MWETQYFLSIDWTAHTIPERCSWFRLCLVVRHSWSLSDVGLIVRFCLRNLHNVSDAFPHLSVWKLWVDPLTNAPVGFPEVMLRQTTAPHVKCQTLFLTQWGSMQKTSKLSYKRRTWVSWCGVMSSLGQSDIFLMICLTIKMINAMETFQKYSVWLFSKPLCKVLASDKPSESGSVS